jgi:predicted transcriptional regulator/transcriptional regulator with XRE-family HTH domain
MPRESTIGSKVRALRRAQRITQSELARRLGISASYLNLIEHNRRPLPAELLVELAKVLPIDLKALSAAQDGRLEADLLEAFGDPLFDDAPVMAGEVRELASTYSNAARAILQLYGAYRGARESTQNLADQMVSQGGGDVESVQPYRFPTEEVSDLLQLNLNYFPDLEEGAESLVRETQLKGDSLFSGLAAYLQRTRGIEVRIQQTAPMQSALRRYDPDRRILHLSEVLRRGSRNFQLAHQIGLLTQQEVLDRIASNPILTTPESRALCRVALANYFASAVLMPYEAFLRAARTERYDIELLGHRFRASFEQTCHRLTTLRRPGAEGIPFHMIRIDMAGNISKRFSASGLRFPRFSGACPRWNVFGAFQTPGMIRTQLSQFPEGQVYFEVSRTVRKQSGGFHSRHTQFAISLGCDVSYAREMVYADGLDLESREALIPVGPTCRLCDRMDCEQRAFPPVQHALTVNEDVRGVSFYAPLKG